MRVRGIVALAVPLWLAATAPRLYAHAFLERATPAVGSTVEAAPAALELDFSEAVELAFSSIEVVDLDRRIPVKTGALERPKPRTLSFPLPALAPGEYEVRWKVVSVDAHESQGTFRFRVAPYSA
jgi:methionine-rich copper-binding protein CopC